MDVVNLWKGAWMWSTLVKRHGCDQLLERGMDVINPCKEAWVWSTLGKRHGCDQPLERGMGVTQTERPFLFWTEHTVLACGDYYLGNAHWTWRIAKNPHTPPHPNPSHQMRRTNFGQKLCKSHNVCHSCTAKSGTNMENVRWVRRRDDVYIGYHQASNQAR